MASGRLRVLSVQQKGARIYAAVVKAQDLFPLYSASARHRLSDVDMSPASNEEELEGIVAAIPDIDGIVFESEISELKPYSEDASFQRLLDMSRVRGIANYLIREEGILPNGVILAARSLTETRVLSPDESRADEGLEYTWPDDSVPFNVVDGQHRLEALRYLTNLPEHAEFGEFELVVTLLLDLPYFEQAELFAVINGRQKPVNRSRIYDLLGYRSVQNEQLMLKAYAGDLAISRFCHQIVKVLQRSSASPWKDRIKMRGEGDGIVTQAAFVDNLMSLVQPRKESIRLSRLPLLYDYFRRSDLVGASRVCIKYFKGVQRAWPKYWTTNDDLKNSLFGKSNGVAIMLWLFHDLAVLNKDVASLEIEEVERMWLCVREDRLANPPSGGSKGEQKEIVHEFREQMLGPTAEFQIAAAKNEIIPRLRSLQALF